MRPTDKQTAHKSSHEKNKRNITEQEELKQKKQSYNKQEEL